MILILTDDADDREALVDLLESEGYRTRSAAGAATSHPAEGLVIDAEPRALTLRHAHGATTLPRPVARHVLLTRVVEALAAELHPRCSIDERFALAS